MCDCVSPGVQFFQSIATELVVGTNPQNFWPEFQAEAIEVAAQITGIRIAGVEFSVGREGRS
jgi:hypothetical protein